MTKPIITELNCKKSSIFKRLIKDTCQLLIKFVTIFVFIFLVILYLNAAGYSNAQSMIV